MDSAAVASLFAVIALESRPANSGRRTVTYLTLKWLHMVTAILTISGFILRGYWMFVQSPKLHSKLVRVAPHIVDTVFLLSGVALIAVLHLQVMSQPWLIAKFAGLIAYIVLGTIAIKRGKTMQVRAIAFVLALAVFGYIVGVATSKSAFSWLHLLN